jgi:ribosomal protein S18 acetylase RimI-like enzyme
MVLQGVRARIRDARPEDCEAIASIAGVAVPETYRDLCDAAVIHSIVQQSYAPTALRETIERCRAEPDAHFLVAERQGEIVGFLHYDCAGPEPELHRIYVETAQKRVGIGTSLTEELHSRLPSGASYILMVVAANRPAVAFYHRFGFVDAAHVDGPTYMHEHMGVSFPPGTAPAPALVLRFTKEIPR